MLDLFLSVETRDSLRQSFKLRSAAWNVSGCLDAVHQAFFIILDARTTELAFCVATISISHINFPSGGHQILQHLLLGLLDGFLLLSLDFWHFSCPKRVDWLWLHWSLSPLDRPLASFTIRLFLGNRVIVVIVIFEALVRDVVIGRSVFHKAVN